MKKLTVFRLRQVRELVSFGMLYFPKPREHYKILAEAFRKCGAVALFTLAKSKSFARLATCTPDGLWLVVAEIVERKRAEEKAAK